MLKNQSNTERKVPPHVQAALTSMYAVLDKAASDKADLMRDVNQPFQTAFRQPAQKAFRQPEPQNQVLNIRQLDGAKQIKEACQQINKMRGKINEAIISYKLDMPMLDLFELSDLLMRLDRLLSDTQVTLKRTGVVGDCDLSKGQHAYLDRNMAHVVVTNADGKVERLADITFEEYADFRMRFERKQRELEERERLAKQVEESQKKYGKFGEHKQRGKESHHETRRH